MAIEKVSYLQVIPEIEPFYFFHRSVIKDDGDLGLPK
jgi:hypothetical protein